MVLERCDNTDEANNCKNETEIDYFIEHLLLLRIIKQPQTDLDNLDS